MQLDERDFRILAELEQDADRTNAALATAVGLSPAATLNRVRRLKEGGLITRITARVEPAKAGFSLQVYVMVTLGRHDEAAHRRLEEAIRGLPQVLSGDWVTGETDALLTVAARNISELQRVLLLLSSRGGAQRVTTLLRLEEIKPRSPLPLAVSQAAEAGKRTP